MTPRPIRIGTRASRLALAQSGQMQARIASALAGRPVAIGSTEAEALAPLVTITTSGDRIQDRRLLELGGKALFTKEIEEALLDGRIDLAVHSMKDVPAVMPDGLVIAAVPEREDVRDAFVSPKAVRFDALPKGARLGTASLRRQAQALARRPDLDVVMLRGNVDTRLAKLAAGECDATLLALAGLNRLGMAQVTTELLDPLAIPPAPGQGALAIQTRMEDGMAPWLAGLHHAPTELAVAAERGALEALEGSCRTAIGAYAVVDGAELSLVVEALLPDGSRRYRREGRATLDLAAAVAQARALGQRFGEEIRTEGGAALLAAI